MRTRLNAIACLLFAAGVTAHGGQSSQDPQPSVFRTAADFVRVDMYPTRNGELVTDLRPEEVEVFEDGVRQRIETFEHVRVPATAAALAQAEPEAPAEPSEDARSRVFVIFIDTHSTRLEGQSELRLALVRFLDQLLGPTDLVGLMTPEMRASDLALGRRATVISDLANDERWLRRIAGPENLKDFAWENCYPSQSPRAVSGRLAEMRARHQGKDTMGALHDLVAHLRDLREERKAVLLVTAGWPFTEASVLATPGRVESESCAADRRVLERTNFTSLLKDLAKAANRANVSFYPVNSRREQRFPPELRASTRAFLRQSDKRAIETIQDQLESLAEETDGMAEVKTTNLAAITERIMTDTSAYYLLAYQSSNSKADGRFRSITVKINRAGVRVRARRGYGGETPPPVLIPEEPLRAKPVLDERVVTALTSVERFDSSAPFWGRSSAWDGPGAASGAFWYIGEIGAQTRAQLQWTAGATVEIVVLASDKTQVMTRTFDLGPLDSSFSVRVPEEGALAAGDYAVRVRLRPTSEDAVSVVHDTLRVTLDAGPVSLGEAVLWRRGPSTRLNYLQTADPRFRRTERLRLELPTTSDDMATARVLDRAGQPLQIPAEVSERADAAGEFQWIVVDTPVAALAPGDYAIEVTQSGTSRVTAFRMIP
jgi:VWFA-related protein